MTFKNGLNAEKSRYGHGVKFANVLDVLSRDPIRRESIIGSVFASEDQVSNFGLRYGDILFQRSSETREDAGQCNTYLDHEVAVFGGFVIRGRPGREVEPRFLHALLKTSAVRRTIQQYAGGSTRYNIGQESLANVMLKLPACVEEKSKIASQIAALDLKIRAISAKMGHIESFRRGLIQRLFP